MDLTRLALEEIAYEGLQGITLNGLWKVLQKRRPPIKCAIDKWTKPFIWNHLAQSKFIDFYHVDFDSPRQPDIPKNQGERSTKLPMFWINDHRCNMIGYCQTYFYRTNVNNQIKGDQCVKMKLDEAVKKWGDFLYIVATQPLRQRTLFGNNNPPVIDDVIPVRYIMLEIIGKSRWEGFMQADFLKMYGMDSRTSFHHLKILIRLRLITKQSILLKPPVNNFGGGQPIPPKSTKMLHLSQFSNVYTNNLQKAASKICSLLESAPDGIMERNELKQACSDVVTFKKIRQWLFQAGYIQYIVNGEIWNADNINPTQVSHFRAGRPCYVNLLKPFDVTDIDDDKDDEFLDYIENCDDIEPQLVYEETLHHQAYRVIVACREKGVTMKKLAEILCVPFTMARSFIRYFDTNKVGRIINVDHLKLKLQKIVAIQYLHQSETIQKIQSNQLKIAQHKASLVDEKGDIKIMSPNTSSSSLTQQNLDLADRLDLTRVSEKSKVSVRHLARKNYVMDLLKEKPVFEGMHEMYKSLISSEESVKSTQGLCCRKTFRKILTQLVEEKQIKRMTAIIDDRCTPPIAATYFCSMVVDENSLDYFDAVNATKTRHMNLEKRRELKKSVLDKDTKVKVLSKGIPKSVLTKCESVDNPTKIKLDFNEVNDVFSDTDDENFKKSVPLSTAHDVNSKFLTYARFQKLHVMHIYLWKLVYGVDVDIEQLQTASHSLSGDTFIDLVQSRHIWLQHVNGLPEYKEGVGWFNVGDIIALMPLEVTCRVLGIKCWSETAIKYLQDPKKRLLKMCQLPPRLKYKLLVSNANKQHIDNCVDLLVLLAQMGLLAVSPTFYPKIRTEIMIYLRREAKIMDTRFSQKTYCHTVLPPGVDRFPETIYRFQSLVDVEKYWTDLQFVCLNTPLGLNRAQRNLKYEAKIEELSENDEALGKRGLLLSTKSKGANLGRNYRSFTILKDFQQYYQDKDFDNLEPVIFGNGLGAGGLDSVFFGHLAKNWRYGKQRGKVKRNRETTVKKVQPNIKKEAKASEEVSCKQMIVSNIAVQQRRGGKGLKRKLASNKAVLTKKMKLERKKYFDRMIAKRIENVREKIRQKEQSKKKAIRKGKKMIAAMNHDDIDRAALRKMKGIRVSFSEREDAYILLAEIVRTMMRLYEKGQPLEKEHKKIVWQAIRDLLHREVPESCDKTWQAIDRRARNTKRYPHFMVIYKTCMAELEQDKDFKASLVCTKTNWKEKMVSAFAVARESYSRHFNYPIHIEKFPSTLAELHKQFNIEYAHKEGNAGKELHKRNLSSDKELRTSLLEDLIYCALTAQKLTSYIPAVAFKVFDAYPPGELNEAFEYYKQNKLISRYRIDLPRRRSLPISTMTYNLSTTYYRMFEPVIPLRIFQMSRSMFLHIREGKVHDLLWKESDILKLPSYYEKGSCLIDYAHLQGGHLAFILSAVATKKIILDFTLPDEMTISDEDHFKKLKEGRLNYQRVAFEQRIRRGETLVHKRLRVDRCKDLLEKSYCDFMSSDANQKCNTVKNGVTEKGLGEMNKTVEKNDIYDADFMRECQSKESCTSRIHDQVKGVAGKRGRSPSQSNVVYKLSPTKANTSENKRVTFDDSSFEDSLSKDTNNSPLISSHMSNLRQHGVIRGFLKSSDLSFCSYNYFKTLDIDKCRQCSSQGTTKNIFLYTSEAPKSKRRLLADKINMFKESKLHASRTSLSMQRSLTSERFVPTNAMNTHDALVMNPMEVMLQSKASSFRHLPKPKKTDKLKEIWEAFYQCTYDSNESKNISLGEYCSMLKNHMGFSDHVLKDHVNIINKVHSMGVFGLKLKEFQKTFHTLSGDVSRNWRYHIQILLGLQMLYSIGHFEEALVAPAFYYSWCFRSPQVFSRFEESVRLTVGSSITEALPPCSNQEKDQEIDIASFDITDAYPPQLRREKMQEIAMTDFKITDVLSLKSNSVKDKEIFTSNSNSKNTIPGPYRDKEIENTFSAITDASSEINQVEPKEIGRSTFNIAEVSLKSYQMKDKDRVENDPLKNSTSGSIHVKDTSCEKVPNRMEDYVDDECSEGVERTVPMLYKNVKVLPWLKLSGETNNVLLKRIQETVLAFVMANPGILEADVLSNFVLLLKPVAAQKILQFLEINGAITRHYQWKKKATIFDSTVDYEAGDHEMETYIMPTMQCLLNMTDSIR